MARGKFIVIDGGEGAGKGTQIQRLKELYPGALFTREPGGSEYAEEIRNVILNSPNAKGASAETQFALFWAARADHIKRKIAPALDAGRHVVTDRFDSSSYAYQMHGQEGAHSLKDLFFILRERFLGEYVPDLYIFFEVDPEIGAQRVASRKGEVNHFDERAKDFHERVMQGYREFAKSYPDRVRFVSANGTREEVAASLLEILRPLLGDVK